MVSTVALQQENSLSEPGFSVCCLHVLSVSEWVPSGCSGSLPHSKDMQVRLSGNYKLSAGGVWAKMVVCLYVSTL